MAARKIMSIFMVFLIFLPTIQGWSQSLEDQAQFYLQKIGPGQAPSTQSSQMPSTTQPLQIPSTQPQSRSDLPQQIPSPPQPAQVLTSAPRQPEEISAVERRAWTRMMFVKQYGYSFFYQPPASFLPVQAVPVGPDYVIGPGDTIRVIIWGSVQGEYNLTVDRNGQVEIPKVGVVHVSSMTFKQLRQVMDREFARQYNNFQMSVTLDNLRTIQVYVVGQARFPGSYAVSSLSTLVSALFAAGGPGKSGSLRDIQVRRGGKVITHFDMYDFLLRGDKRRDIRLQSEDVIFIPPIGPMVAIGTPKTDIEIGAALKTLARVTLQAEDSQPGYSQGQQSYPQAQQGYSQATKTPELSWKKQEDMRIMEPNKEEPRVGRIKPPADNWLDQETIDKEKEFEKRYGISLTEAVTKLATSKGLDLGGPVKVQGIYELKNEKNLRELLALAGGLGDTAFKGRVQVLRVEGRQSMVLLDEDLGKVISQRESFRLVDGDLVEIFGVPEMVENKVAIAGAVKNPGEFGFRDNMRVKDLIGYAGGILQQADKSQAEITRVNITTQGPETTRFYFRLFGALNNLPQDNVVLKPNDYLFIRTVPNWDIYKTVQIAGEVKSPGTYSIQKGELLSSVLARTGGFTAGAYLLGGVLIRESTKVLQKQQLNAAIDRLQARVLATAGEKATVAIDSEEAKSAESASKQQQMLITALRKVEPLGRVVIQLDDPERLRGTPNDITLQEGDRLIVPLAPGTVNVVGAVFAPTALVYSPYRTVKEYLTMAGGTTEIAEDKEIYVIKANGAAVSRKGFSWLKASWDGTKYGYHPGGISSLRLDPGDTIVVPEQLERIPWLKNLKDIASILGGIALTAGVAFAALR
jgi:protein involved in polysaccharide export with SLBB domain